jgi:hypothetical protein
MSWHKPTTTALRENQGKPCMGQITVRFDIPEFDFFFTWECDEQEAAALVDGVASVARRFGVDPAEYMLSAVVGAPSILTRHDTVMVRDALKTITAYVLQQRTGNPHYPGRIIDFISIHDFKFVVSRIANGRMEGKISTHPPRSPGRQH